MKRKFGMCAALASAVMMLGATTAYASDANVRTTDAMQTGLAIWTESRDELKVCDSLNDEWTIVGWIYRPNPGDPSTGPTVLRVTDSVANSVCNYTADLGISETINIYIKVCLLRVSDQWVRNCSYKRIPR